MNRILKWLQSKFSHRSTAESPSPAGVTGEETVDEENFDSEHTPTVPILTIVDESPLTVVETKGFDPYNSGSFGASKSPDGK